MFCVRGGKYIGKGKGGGGGCGGGGVTEGV